MIAKQTAPQQLKQAWPLIHQAYKAWRRSGHHFQSQTLGGILVSFHRGLGFKPFSVTYSSQYNHLYVFTAGKHHV